MRSNEKVPGGRDPDRGQQQRRNGRERECERQRRQCLRSKRAVLKAYHRSRRDSSMSLFPLIESFAILQYIGEGSTKSVNKTAIKRQ